MKAKIEEIELYDKKVTSERLYQLHANLEMEYGEKISGLRLTEMISEKTGIKIGGNTYNKHESFNNSNTMSIELLVALSRFYDVSYDYILGYSDSMHPERENTQKKYGLSDASLDVLQNIKLLDKRQQKDEPNAPTDLEIINALFESGEFQDWVTLIKKSIVQKERRHKITDIDSINKRTKLISSLSDEQVATCNDGALTVLSSTETDQFLKFQLQQTTLNLVNDIIDNLY